MKRLWQILFVLLLCLTIFATVTAQTPVFRIGVLDEDRGAISNGARLAVAQINDSGGVLGADGSRFRLELVIQSVESLGLPDAVANLGQASVIAVLGPQTLSQLPNDLTALQALNVPVLTPALDDTLILSDLSGLIFRSRAAEVWQGRALADYLVRQLAVTRVATIQLDLESTAANVGFTTAARGVNLAVDPALLLQGGSTVETLAADVLQANPQAIVAYGIPEQLALLYNTLRAAGWDGIFACHHADSPEFRALVPLERLAGVIGTSTWTFSAPDENSDIFLNDYVRAYGEVPGAVEAAAYDSINLLATAIALPGELVNNLPRLDNVNGVQGLLRPVQLQRGETSTYVTVVQLGRFGAPEVVARYAGGQQISVDTPPAGPTNTPAPILPSATPTPQGVVLTITSSVQNVRSGPGLNYDILGQLRQGDQVPIIGASVDFAWVVINFRGQQGWLATYLLDVFGDLNTVPVVQPPPTPTPLPATATPTLSPNADIVVIAATPNNITVGVGFNIQITVRNQGNVNAGPFAVAASFPPDNLYSAVNLSGLGAQQQTFVSLTGTLSGGTGRYTAIIIADLNNQVAEGTAGEANNNAFAFSYLLDRPLLATGQITLNPGGTLDLENNSVAQDIRWNGGAIEVVGANFVVVIPATDYNNIHYDALSPAIINQTSIPVTSLAVGSVVGVITVDGRRGALRVDGVTPGAAITLTYRVYQ
ncbi:MAG: ABC transporter substrate-binding protein [Chloroflexi bacterium]|nr:ABC transporter substrate-binding protein [Chloroflexota bacterium]